jgi:hypothetical protein
MESGCECDSAEITTSHQPDAQARDLVASVLPFTLDSEVPLPEAHDRKSLISPESVRRPPQHQPPPPPPPHLGPPSCPSHQPPPPTTTSSSAQALSPCDADRARQGLQRSSFQRAVTISPRQGAQGRPRKIAVVSIVGGIFGLEGSPTSTPTRSNFEWLRVGLVWACVQRDCLCLRWGDS